MEGKTYVIGDIHGAALALQALLERLPLATGDRLVFLGDYVDGWPEPVGVVEQLIRVSHRCSCIFLRGNHDIWIEDWLKGRPANRIWLENGGRATLRDYEARSPVLKRRHLEFFGNLSNYYIDEKNRLFVHGGFTALKGPQMERSRDYLFNDRSLLETALALNPALKPTDPYFPRRLRLFHELYIGHTPTLHFEVKAPLRAGNLWLVDTGATKGWKVSALEIEHKEVYQSPPVSSLYPDFKKR